MFKLVAAFGVALFIGGLFVPNDAAMIAMSAIGGLLFFGSASLLTLEGKGY